MSGNEVSAVNCGCKNEHKHKKSHMHNTWEPISTFPAVVEYGEAYVPFQADVEKIYTPEAALLSGTIFPELDKPYVKQRRCGCEQR